MTYLFFFIVWLVLLTLQFIAATRRRCLLSSPEHTEPGSTGRQWFPEAPEDFFSRRGVFEESGAARVCSARSRPQTPVLDV